MALQTLPIRKPFYDADPHAKVLRVDQARDCYYENTEEGSYAIRRRPGYSSFSTITSGGFGQGLFWSDRFGAVFAVANGKLYRIEQTGVATQLTGAVMGSSQKVTFAEAQDLALDPFIYIAHGGTLRYTDGASLLTPSDPNVPTNASLVVALNNRIWADNGGQDFYTTDTDPDTGLLDPFYWSSVNNPWRAAQKADVIRAMYAAWNQVSIWGSQTIEYWQEDGVNPISPLVGAISEFGIEAVHTIIKASNTLFCLGVLDGKRAVVKLVDRAPQIVSAAIDRQLQDMDHVLDATGSLVFIGGVNLYAINFPTEKQTWAYDIKEDLWLEWGEWQSGSGTYKHFPIVGSCYAKSWNKHLFQGIDGSIYQFDRSTYRDNGNTIRTLIRTGWVDHGTMRRKRSDRLFIKLKAYNPTDATLLLRWRNDGRPEWSNFVELSLGSSSEQTHHARLTRMGTYRSRQYEFVMSDNADLALMGIQEDVQELAS